MWLSSVLVSFVGARQVHARNVLFNDLCVVTFLHVHMFFTTISSSSTHRLFTLAAFLTLLLCYSNSSVRLYSALHLTCVPFTFRLHPVSTFVPLNHHCRQPWTYPLLQSPSLPSLPFPPHSRPLPHRPLHIPSPAPFPTPSPTPRPAPSPNPTTPPTPNPTPSLSPFPPRSAATCGCTRCSATRGAARRYGTHSYGV